MQDDEKTSNVGFGLHPTACNLCYANCGILVEVNDGHIAKVAWMSQRVLGGYWHGDFEGCAGLHVHVIAAAIVDHRRAWYRPARCGRLRCCSN